MKRLKIAFVTPEAVPYAKTGGLADVSGVLPGTLSQLGHSVRLVMPMYRQVKEQIHDLVLNLENIEIDVGGKLLKADIFCLKDKSTGTDIYFISNDSLFDRPELYRDNLTGNDYKDNLFRFAFFSRAALRIFKLIDWQPDILHSNDWQSALIPVYLKTEHKDDPFYKKTASIFTIHNMAYQGQFDAEEFINIGLPKGYFAPESEFEFWGRINLMKAAICWTDLITTVSPTYAMEIQETDEYGMGLEGVLKNRSNDIFGILNGVDYDVWSPEKDKLIFYRYSAENLAGKKRNKQILLRKAGFSFDKERPVIGMISRLDSQKGFDILQEIMEDVLKLDLQFILLGTGSRDYHEYFRELSKKYSHCFRAFLQFDNRLAHLIEAGADMFLMPSRYEPSGLNQMYSLRYGTVPIVRKTGGLADTIENYDEVSEQGTGFVFDEYSSAALIKVIKRARKLFGRKKIWNKIIKTGMGRDFSWSSSAQKYIEIYKKAMDRL